MQLTAQMEGAESLLVQVLTPEQIASGRQHHKIRLMISAGGAKRETFYVKNILSQQDLPLRGI